MAILKFLRRDRQEPARAQARGTHTAEAVQQVRRVARRRLIGAVVLLGVGVIGFPLVFQTQPRPIPVDIPIEIPRKDGLAPLAVTPLAVPSEGNSAAGSATALAASAPSTIATPASPAAVAEPAAPVMAPAATTTVAPKASPAPRTPNASDRSGDKHADKHTDKHTDKHSEKPVDRTVERTAEKATEKSVEKPAEKPSDRAPAPGRFAVQAGAYTDAEVVQEVRGRLERLGFKTFVQGVEVDGAMRTRVRIGPFATRQEAQDAAQKVKGAGLAASLVPL